MSTADEMQRVGNEIERLRAEMVTLQWELAKAELRLEDMLRSKDRARER
jgi:hypothetical protein